MRVRSLALAAGRRRRRVMGLSSGELRPPLRRHLVLYQQGRGHHGSRKHLSARIAGEKGRKVNKSGRERVTAHPPFFRKSECRNSRHRNTVTSGAKTGCAEGFTAYAAPLRSCAARVRSARAECVSDPRVVVSFPSLQLVKNKGVFLSSIILPTSPFSHGLPPRGAARLRFPGLPASPSQV